jgi:ABC-type multidrug transport system fused ATPase/permease subunit
MRFFDQTPLGRLLNRFSKDLDQIDSLLPEAMIFSLHGILASISIVILIATIFPYVLLTLIPLGIGFYFSVRYYRRSSRELRRLDGILTSPVYAHLSASLSGISVIRAYRAQARFETDYVTRVDKATAAVLAFEAANRWIGTRLGTFAGAETRQ